MIMCLRCKIQHTPLLLSQGHLTNITRGVILGVTYIPSRTRREIGVTHSYSMSKFYRLTGPTDTLNVSKEEYWQSSTMLEAKSGGSSWLPRPSIGVTTGGGVNMLTYQVELFLWRHSLRVTHFNPVASPAPVSLPPLFLPHS